MKKDIHPTNFRPVIFHDISSGEKFLMGSTVGSDKTEKWTDGNEYSIVEVETSSASHPFYTGNEKIMDTGGRVDRFKRRMASAVAKPAKKKSAPVEETKKEISEEVAESPVEEVKEEVVETVEEVVTEAPAEETASEETTENTEESTEAPAEEEASTEETKEEEA